MIRNRSEGILTFIEGDRKVSKLPTPKLSSFPIKVFFDNLELLFKRDFTEYGISFIQHIQPVATGSNSPRRNNKCKIGRRQIHLILFEI